MQKLKLASAAIAGLVVSGEGWANDRDLLATPVPASSCVQELSVGPNAWSNGLFVLSGVVLTDPPQVGPNVLNLRCALPVNNVEKSGPVGIDNDITKFRVFYRDSDARGSITTVSVTLNQTWLIPAGFVQRAQICTWNSTTSGTATIANTASVVPCVHDVAPGAFYHFNVTLTTTAPAGLPEAPKAGNFAGIDFPK